MSSEGADAVTGKLGSQHGLVPNMRFPEFNGHSLHEVRLGDVTEEATTRNGNRLAPASVMGVSKVDGIVPMQERLVAGNISRYKNVRKNWFAYNPMRLNIGSIARWQGDNDVLVSPDYVVFRCRTQSNPTSLLPEYLDHFRSSTQWEAFTNESGDGGVRIRIYYHDIARMRLVLPDVGEQQKIADCLSSIDALIAAEAGRLDAMKDHKRGLMQQLFPAPGETTPRLRFPEFQNAGEWELKAISEIADLHKGKGISKLDISIDGNQPCIRYGELYTTYGEVIDETLSKTNLPLFELFMSKKNDVIIPSSGETKIDIATASCVMRDNIALGGDLNVIRSRQNGVFLSYFLNGPLKYEIAKVAQGDSVVHLYPTQIGLLRVAIPTTEEQQAIATCLSSIDTRITAQSDKIDALEVHKRGLMQQLFPVAGEVQA